MCACSPENFGNCIFAFKYHAAPLAFHCLNVSRLEDDIVGRIGAASLCLRAGTFWAAPLCWLLQPQKPGFELAVRTSLLSPCAPAPSRISPSCIPNPQPPPCPHTPMEGHGASRNTAPTYCGQTHRKAARDQILPPKGSAWLPPIPTNLTEYSQDLMLTHFVSSFARNGRVEMFLQLT